MKNSATLCELIIQSLPSFLLIIQRVAERGVRVKILRLVTNYTYYTAQTVLLFAFSVALKLNEFYTFSNDFIDVCDVFLGRACFLAAASLSDDSLVKKPSCSPSCVRVVTNK